MNHLRTRNDIMAWLEDHAPRPAIARAMQGGNTELLGVFRRIPPQGVMGWIVSITTKYDIVWHVAIKPNKLMGDYWCHVVSDVPWEHWMGDIEHGELPTATPGTPLYAGDNPEKYKELKNAKTKE